MKMSQVFCGVLSRHLWQNAIASIRIAAASAYPRSLVILFGYFTESRWAAGSSASPAYKDVPFTKVQNAIGPSDERVFFNKIPIMIPTKNMISTFGSAFSP